MNNIASKFGFLLDFKELLRKDSYFIYIIKCTVPDREAIEEKRNNLNGNHLLKFNRLIERAREYGRGHWYVGQTYDIFQRLYNHIKRNGTGSETTRMFKNLELKYIEYYYPFTEEQARSREKELNDADRIHKIQLCSAQMYKEKSMSILNTITQIAMSTRPDKIKNPYT